MVEYGISAHEAHYFLPPLWNPTFSPTAEQLGIIDWFTILLGLASVVALTIHGANWIIFKTNSDLSERLKRIVFRLNIVLLLLVILSLSVWHKIAPLPFHNFVHLPRLILFPAFTFIGLSGLFQAKKFKKDGQGFLFSTLSVLGGFATTAASIFPNVLPSTNNVNPSLTLYNVAVDAYRLSIGINWFIIAILLVAVYMVVQYRIFKRKMADVGYGEH